MSRQPINVYPARTVLARTRGLIFMTPLPPSSAMHIKPCWCVHTGLLRSPIDIVFLDANNKVIEDCGVGAAVANCGEAGQPRACSNSHKAMCGDCN